MKYRFLVICLLCLLSLFVSKNVKAYYEENFNNYAVDYDLDNTVEWTVEANGNAIVTNELIESNNMMKMWQDDTTNDYVYTEYGGATTTDDVIIEFQFYCPLNPVSDHSYYISIDDDNIAGLEPTDINPYIVCNDDNTTSVNMNSGASDDNITGLPSGVFHKLRLVINLNSNESWYILSSPATTTKTFYDDISDSSENIIERVIFYARTAGGDTNEYIIIDNFKIFQEDELAPSSLTWHFPQNSYIIDNSEWNDWGVYYNLSLSWKYAVLRIMYQDSQNTYMDFDYISTTTQSSIYWTTNRSNDLADGTVNAWGEILGTNLENCTLVTDEECLWYSIATLPTIIFTASSTGSTIFDYGVISFTPATSTDELNFMEETFYTAIETLSFVFPFNIGINVYEQWRNSEIADLPSEFSFLDIVDESGNMSLELPEDIFGDASTTIVVFGTSMFTQNQEQEDFFDAIKSLSTLLLYLAFVAGIIWRGHFLYEEYTA